MPPGQDPQVLVYVRKNGKWLTGPGGVPSSSKGGIAQGLGNATMSGILHATATAKARVPTDQEKVEAEERKEREREELRDRKDRIKRVMEGNAVKSLVKHSISFNAADYNSGGPSALSYSLANLKRRNTVVSTTCNRTNVNPLKM